MTRFFTTILSVLFAFTLGVFVENNFKLIQHAQHYCPAVSGQRCPCDNCPCCPACPGQGGNLKKKVACLCPEGKCPCCVKCPGHNKQVMFDKQGRLQVESLVIRKPGSPVAMYLSGTDTYAGVWIVNEETGRAAHLYNYGDEAACGVFRDYHKSSMGFNAAIAVSKYNKHDTEEGILQLHDGEDENFRSLTGGSFQLK